MKAGSPFSVVCKLPPWTVLRGGPGWKAANSPAQNDTVVKEVHLDVLQADGLIEALRDEEPEKPPEVGRVEERDTNLLGKSP